MSEAWDWLVIEMLRPVIREYLAHPVELLTFRNLSRLVASDADVPHAVAEQRSDLFMITPMTGWEAVSRPRRENWLRWCRESDCRGQGGALGGGREARSSCL